MIYYTTNGTAPTTSSFVYTSPIVPGTGTTTIQAMAVASGLTQSTVATATYVVAQPVTAAPIFSPAGGTYTTAPNVTLSDSTAGAVIYYTTNGTTPTTSSFVYTGAIVVGTGTTTIQAMAVASGSSQSAVVAATYVVGQGVTASPSFSPAAGTYATAQSVTLSDSTAGAVIYYTTNGTTPTTSSAVYATPIPVTTSETIQAIAVAANAQASAVVTAAYVIQTGTPSINFGSGFSSVAGLTLNGNALNTSNQLQLTTTVGTYQAGSAFWNQPVRCPDHLRLTSPFSCRMLKGTVLLSRSRAQDRRRWERPVQGWAIKRSQRASPSSLICIATRARAPILQACIRMAPCPRFLL